MDSTQTAEPLQDWEQCSVPCSNAARLAAMFSSIYHTAFYDCRLNHYFKFGQTVNTPLRYTIHSAKRCYLPMFGVLTE